MLTAEDKRHVESPRPMNVRLIAVLLSADQELEKLGRGLKRNRDWSSARRIADVRSALQRALRAEQMPLYEILAEYGKTGGSN